jgi:hypothetical protein
MGRRVTGKTIKSTGKTGKTINKAVDPVLLSHSNDLNPLLDGGILPSGMGEHHGCGY